jgi:hypothetical protein
VEKIHVKSQNKKIYHIWDKSVTRIIMSWKKRAEHGSFLVACSLALMVHGRIITWTSLALTGSWENYYMEGASVKNSTSISYSSSTKKSLASSKVLTPPTKGLSLSTQFDMESTA